MAAGATYEPIATTTLGSAASSITFSSISSAYTDLRLVWVGSTSSATFIRMQLNSDTATNYSTTYLNGNGTTAASLNSVNSSNMAQNSAATTIGNKCMITSDWFSYAGSTYKTALNTWINDVNGSGLVENKVFLWRSTAAISTIYLYLSAGNFEAGTIATIYGIKAA